VIVQKMSNINFFLIIKNIASSIFAFIAKEKAL